MFKYHFARCRGAGALQAVLLFETVVGRMQPILAELPQAITRAVLPAAAHQGASSPDIVADIESRASEAQTGGGFDIDAVNATCSTKPALSASISSHKQPD